MYERDPLAVFAELFLTLIESMAPAGREQEIRDAAVRLMQDAAAGRSIPRPAPLIEHEHLPLRTVPDVQPTPAAGATIHPFAEYAAVRDHGHGAKLRLLCDPCKSPQTCTDKDECRTGLVGVV